MNKRSYLLILLSLIFISALPAVTYAQITPSDQERALRNLEQSQQKQQNLLKELEDEQEQRIREKKKPKVEIPQPEQKQVTGGPCFNINTIELSGATILQGKDKDKIIKPYLGTCMGISEINKLMRDITNYYVDNGYVTTRVAVTQQDLKSGLLTIVVMEGIVEDIILNENSLRDRLQVATAFPFIKGRILNLRDIEQGLDQLNRLSSSNATMQLVPGDKSGGTKIVISNKASRTVHQSDMITPARMQQEGIKQMHLWKGIIYLALVKHSALIITRIQRTIMA